MNQQPSESEIKKLLEHLKYPSQTDIMQQQLFFIQTEAIRQQRINDQRIVEALMNIAANNPSFSARKEANKTLKYLGITPPPIDPKIQIKEKPNRFQTGAIAGGAASLLPACFILYVFVASSNILCSGWWLLIFVGGVSSGFLGGVVSKTPKGAALLGAFFGLVGAGVMILVPNFLLTDSFVMPFLCQ